jgi:hypothetical protein
MTKNPHRPKSLAQIKPFYPLDMVDILQVWIFFQDENKQKKNRKLIDNN